MGGSIEGGSWGAHDSFFAETDSFHVGSERGSGTLFFGGNVERQYFPRLLRLHRFSRVRFQVGLLDVTGRWQSCFSQSSRDLQGTRSPLSDTKEYYVLSAFFRELPRKRKNNLVDQPRHARAIARHQFVYLYKVRMPVRQHGLFKLMPSEALQA